MNQPNPTNQPPKPASIAFRWLKGLVRWSIRLIVAIALLAGALALFSPYILKYPPLERYVLQKIEALAQGQLAYDSLGFSPFGSLVISGLRYEIEFQENLWQAQADSVRAFGLWRDDISILVNDLSLAMADEQIAGVSQAEISLRDAWKAPTLQASFNRGLFKPFAVELASATPSVRAASDIETTTPDLNWLERIEFRQIAVELPQVEPPWLWRGSLEPQNEYLAITLRLTPASQPADRYLQSEWLWHLAGNRLENLSLQASHFSVASAAPNPFSATLHGDVTMMFEDELYHINSQLQITDLRAAAPNIEHIQTAGMQVQLQADLDQHWQLLKLNKTIDHEAVAIQQSDEMAWQLPAGQSTLSASSQPPAITLLWQSPDLGEIQIESTEFPIAATSPLQVKAQIRQQRVPSIIEQLPPYLRESLPPIQGRVSLGVDAQIENAQLQNYQGHLQLTDAASTIATVHIHDATLSGAIHGSSSQHHLQLQGRSGLGIILFATQPVELEPEAIEPTASINSEEGTYHLTIPETGSKYLNPVSFQMRSPLTWSVEGRMDAAQSLATFVKEALPHVPRQIEGMGTLDITLNGSKTQLIASATSADLTLYSFDQNPAFGVQLRDFTTHSQLDFSEGLMRAETRLQASTPYFSYDGKDIEWPGDSLTMSANSVMAEPLQFSATLSPPGGGAIQIQSENESVAAQLDALDLKHFVVPLINQLGLDWQDPPYEAAGKLDGHVTLAPDGKVEGVLKLAGDTIHVTGPPAIRIHQADVRLPLVYPFEPSRFQKKSIQFQAGQIAIGEARFNAPQAEFPLSATTIIPLQNLQVPLFGGTVSIDTLQIQNWLSDSPGFSAQFTLDQIQFSHLHRIYSSFPQQGSLSGTIENVAFSQKRFEFNGNLTLEVFDGRIGLQNLFIENPFASPQTVGFDAWMDAINLERLTQFFNYGKMTGRISGRMQNAAILLPQAGSDQWPRPIRFNLELEKVDKGTGIINRKALHNLINLSEDSSFSGSMADMENYFYTQLGLRAVLEGNNLKLYGTAKDGLFLYADGKKRFLSPNLWFAVPVNIKLARQEQVIPFETIWRRLRAQVNMEDRQVHVR